MTLLATFDPSADPWGIAMIVCAGVCGFALLWWLVAVLMRQPARGAGRVLGLGLVGYLGCAIASVAIRVGTPPPAPAPAPQGPAIVLEAKVPVDPDADPEAAATERAAAERAAAERGAAEAAAADHAEASATPTATAGAPAELPSATPVPAAELGPPTLAGREALRFVDEVARDADKCSDAKQIAAAARELPGALSDVPKASVGKAAQRLESCRRKLAWAITFRIRKERVAARRALGEALQKRLREQGMPVLVNLRGAAYERIRIGGATLDPAKAQSLLDGGLRNELVAAGFAEIVLADMKQSIKETPAVRTDAELAADELAPIGLSRKIAAP